MTGQARTTGQCANAVGRQVTQRRSQVPRADTARKPVLLPNAGDERPIGYGEFSLTMMAYIKSRLIAMCGALGAAQPDESVADPVDLRCRLRHLQGSQCADASMP